MELCFWWNYAANVFLLEYHFAFDLEQTGAAQVETPTCTQCYKVTATFFTKRGANIDRLTKELARELLELDKACTNTVCVKFSACLVKNGSSVVENSSVSGVDVFLTSK